MKTLAALSLLLCLPAFAEVSIVEDLRWDHLTLAMRHQCAKDAVQCFSEIPRDLKTDAAFDARYSDCCWQLKLCTAVPYWIDRAFVQEGNLGDKLLEDTARYCAVEQQVDAQTRYDALKAESVKPDKQPDPDPDGG